MDMVDLGAGDKNLRHYALGENMETKKAIQIQRMSIKLGKCNSNPPSQRMRRKLTKCTYYLSSERMEDIIIEVLLRLPAKSLARFKCVSKKWNNYISHDPYFCKHYKDIVIMYIMLGVFNQFLEKIHEFVPTSYQGTMLKMNSYTNTNTFDESLSFLSHNGPICILGASNEFLLCSLQQMSPVNLFICNPITKESLTFPKPICTSFLPVTAKMAFFCKGNFKTSLHYKVVRAQQKCECYNTLTIQVLSSDHIQDGWKELNVTCSLSFHFECNYVHSPISEAGVIYWAAVKKENLSLEEGMYEQDGVLVFDLQQEQSLELEMIVLPGVAGKVKELPCFGQTDGHIVYALCYKKYQEPYVEMWELDKINKEWFMR